MALRRIRSDLFGNSEYEFTEPPTWSSWRRVRIKKPGRYPIYCPECHSSTVRRTSETDFTCRNCGCEWEELS